MSANPRVRPVGRERKTVEETPVERIFIALESTYDPILMQVKHPRVWDFLYRRSAVPRTFVR